MTTATVVLTVDKLDALHDDLNRIVGLLNDEANVPERYESTAKGLLAEADYEVLARASSVVHRMMLWARHPSVSPEAYWK